MKNKILLILLLASMNSFAQEMTIINFEEEEVEVTLLNKEKTKELIEVFNGRRDNELRKKWTARTYRLSNHKILIEFYDGQSALIENEQDFKKLKNIRFIKNLLGNFKKNISYKIEIPFEKGRRLSKSSKASKITKFKSDSNYYNFEVYKLTTNQILYIEEYPQSQFATIYKDIKTLSSEHSHIEEIEYGFEDDEHYMKELAKGNPLNDFEPNQHVVYPKYLENIISSHQLTLKETKVFVSVFWGNLY